jgi:hypothetical protein
MSSTAVDVVVLDSSMEASREGRTHGAIKRYRGP